MASENKQSDSVPMNKLNEVANENYKELSEEFAKSMRGARTGNIRSTASIFGINQARVRGAITLQKEYFSHSRSYYQVPSTLRQIQKI